MEWTPGARMEPARRLWRWVHTGHDSLSGAKRVLVRIEKNFQRQKILLVIAPRRAQYQLQKFGSV